MAREGTTGRLEDMSARGRLMLTRQDDGDIIVEVWEVPERLHGDFGAIPTVTASVEFCASGGRSPRTLVALRALFDAMDADNNDPQFGERGRPERM